ncbi:glycosyltransferase [Clostridium sp. MSJ-11]|uniref:Glycosyltransferase n=1 Tax=Clostridium mobile TaxID=2841512 RepID=A0ABS6EF61_9CLOT|nr:glycosyltransferase [Clostridium mobile]MBU5483650.1 glycosyltransferase [Clostridium mobile]
MATFIQMPTVPYNKMTQRPQQIMKKLSEMGHKVYYIEDIDDNYLIKKTANLHLVGSKYDMNNLESEKPVILWCSCPDQVLNIDKIRHDYVVYDVVDDASHEFAIWGAYIDEMVRRANVIFTSAENLYDKFSKRHAKVNLVNNGVDLENFSLAKNKKPLDLPTNRKIVGYVGAVASWIDWALINHIVKNSMYNFVFVGPLYNLSSVPLIRSNVYFLGMKNYEELPYYINNFDCCIIPFSINEMTNSCNPIKLYEYMSLGKPVVTTAMKEVQNFSNLCYVSNTMEQFKENIVTAVKEKDHKLENLRKNMAENNSWQKRTEQIIEILKKERIL